MAEAGNVWVSVLPSLSGFKSKVNAQLKGMGDFTVNVGVNVDTKAAQAEIKDATKDQKVNVGVNVDDKAATAGLDEVNRKASSIDGRKLTLTATANVTKALGSLATVAVAANELDKRTLSPKINLDTRGILGDLVRVGSTVLGVGASITRAAGMFSAFSLAGAAAVKTIGSLGPAVSGAVGAAGLLPSAMLAGAATAGTLAIGLHGVGDAITNAFDPTKAKQFNEAMAKLSPNAQAAVREIQSLGGQLTALRMDVQDRLFANAAATIGSLAGNYLPMARAGFGAMATEINAGVVAFAGWLNAPATIGMLRVATDNVTLGFYNLVSGGAQPFLQALTTITAVGTAKLPFIANAIAGAARQFNSFIQGVAASGELDAFFENATTQVGLLFQVLGHLGQIFISVFSAGAAAGGNLLATLVNITGATAAFLQSAQGMSLLTSIFQASSAAMAAAQPLLAAIGQALVVTILPALTTALPAIGSAFGALAPAIAPLGQIIAALAPVLAVVANVIAQVLVVALQALAPIVQALAPLFIQWALAIGGQLIGAIQTLSPLLLTLATFLGQHPALVMGVVSALGALAGGWTVLRTVVGALLTPLTLIRVGMLLFGVSVTQLLGPLFTGASAVGGFIARLSSGFSITSLMGTALRLLGQGALFLVRAVLSAMGPLGWMVTIFTTLYATNEQFRGAVNSLFGALMQLVGAVVSSLQPAFGAFSTVMSTLSNVLGTVLGAVASVLSPILSTLAGWIQTIQPVLVPLIDAFIAWKTATLLLGPAITVAKAAMAGWQAIMDGSAAAMLLANIQGVAMAAWGYAVAAAQWVATAATGAWAAATWVLDAAMSPLGLTILAIVAVIAVLAAAVYLVITNWSTIAGFFTWLWGVVTNAFVTAWNAIVSFLTMVWNSIWGTAVNIWNQIVGFFTGIWNAIWNIVTTVWNAIAGWLSAMFIVHYQLWMQIWNGIVGFFTAIWNWISNIATSTWNAISGFFIAAFNAFVAFFEAIWNREVAFWTMIWNWISSIATTVWNAISAFFVNAFNAFVAFFQMIWNGIVAFFTTIWNWISSIAVNAWNALVAFLMPAINAFSAFFSAVWNGISSFFGMIWGAISNTATAVWNQISGFFTGAFNAFVGFFSGVWNGVADTFGRVWNSIRDTATNVWNGIVGVVKGAVNGVIDAANWMTDKINVVLRFLLIPTIPGIPRLEVGGIIGMARGGRLGARPAYAARGTRIGGGFVTDGPRVVVGEGKRAHPEYVVPTDPAYRGRALALHASLTADLGLAGGAGAAGMDPMRPGPGTPGLAGGGILGWIGNAANWVWQGVTSAAAAVGGALSDAAQWVGGGILALKQQVIDAVNSMLPAGLFHGALGNLAGKVIDAVKAKIDAAVAPPPPAGGAPGAMPSGTLGGWIATALAMTGTPANWAGPLNTLIQRESGGNPHSINLWDSNAAKGTPSMGLMQTIGPTFAAYRDPRLPNDPYDPVANIVAGINYIKARYGSIFNVQQAVGATPRGYDFGGLASGSGFLLKQTVSPERVLSPRQTQAFESLVPLLSQMPSRVPPVEPAGPAAGMPREFRLVGGRIDLGDGFVELVDARLESAASSLDNVRQTT